MPWNSLEWRASRIDDPVERLRYLKKRVKPRRTDTAPPAKRPRTKTPLVCLALLFTCLLIPGFKASSPAERIPAPPVPQFLSGAVDIVPNVWLVEKTDDFETYSNGLKIDDHYAVSNQNRLFYPVYQRGAIDADRTGGMAFRAGGHRVSHHGKRSGRL